MRPIGRRNEALGILGCGGMWVYVGLEAVCREVEDGERGVTTLGFRF